MGFTATNDHQPMAIHGCVQVYSLPRQQAQASGMVAVSTVTELAEALNNLKPSNVLVLKGAHISPRELRQVANRFSVEHRVYLEA